MAFAKQDPTWDLSGLLGGSGQDDGSQDQPVAFFAPDDLALLPWGGHFARVSLGLPAHGRQGRCSNATRPARLEEPDRGAQMATPLLSEPGVILAIPPTLTF